MKKVLSFILVLSMVLSSFGMAFAAPAKNEIAGHLKADATLRLADLGIVKGDDRGFALDANITRAEFAVLLVRALGLEGSANVAKGETQFTDVTVAAGYEWASGAINVATRLGYIQGYGNGKFGPADQIRYEDAITLMVRALGYEPAAQAKGGYPVGYLVVAEQDVKNTKHVEGSTGVAITRGSVFQLLDNSLTKAKMVQVGFGSEAKYVVSGTGKGSDYVEKQTILTTNLGFDEVLGTVVANYRVEKLKANEIKINVEKENGVEVDKTKKYTISDKFDFDVDAILGLKVSVWYNDNNEQIFRYEVETNASDVVYGTVVLNDKDKLVVEVKDKDNKNKKYDWAVRDSKNDIKEAVVYVGNETEDVKDVQKDAYGKFVLNEYGDVAFAYLFEFDEVGVATKVEKDEIEFINLKDADDDVIKLKDADEVFVFNTDFTKASLEDIKAGTALFKWVDEDDNFYIVVKDTKVEGELEAVRVAASGSANDRITVGTTNVSLVATKAMFSDDKGAGYTVWADDIDGAEALVGEKVVAILDLTGRVLALTTDANITSNTVYGIATYITTGRNPVLTVYTNEGKEIDYKFANRDDATIGNLNNKVNSSSNSYGTKIATVSFKLNKDGEIAKGSLEVNDIKDVVLNGTGSTTDPYVAAGAGITALTKDSDHKYVLDAANNKFYLRENTVFVKAYNNSGKLKPSLIKYENIINKDITGPNNNAVVIGTNGRDAKLVVFVDVDFKAVNDAKFGLVTEAVIIDRNDDYTTKIFVAGEGEAKYIVPARNTVKKGDMIEFKVSDKGEITLVGSPLDVKTAAKTDFKLVAKRDGNYVQFDGDTNWYLVDKNTAVWELDKDGSLDKSGSRVAKGDVVYSFADGNEVKVLLVASKFYAKKFGDITPSKPEGTVTGQVYGTYAETDTKIKFVVDGNVTDAYEITANTIYVDVNGNITESIRGNTLAVRRKIANTTATDFELVLTKDGKVESIFELQ